MGLAKAAVAVLALIMIVICVWFIISPQSFFQTFGTSTWLYASIMLTGLAAFAWWVFRVFGGSADSYYAMLESAFFAGVFSAITILLRGDLPAWQFVGWCAIIIAAGCGWLRFLDPRRDK